MSQWATPGSTLIVAVRQDIQPGWHTYWRNPGDSGGPTTLDWTLPAGVRAGEIVWPLPERQRLQSLVNYGYSGSVLLPVPIEVPASARPGQVLALRTQALFMVCSDQMCVPDELPLALDIEVRDGAAPLDPAYGAAIQAVLVQAPRPAPIQARIALRRAADAERGGRTAGGGGHRPGALLCLPGRDRRPCGGPDGDAGRCGADPDAGAGTRGARRPDRAGRGRAGH
ncbi:hypothetical protein MU852_09385 [Brevundimonas albigilva]|uniref:protein-disulfide reductase DsbD domain-containing protein n=1 Tax=Brevundimonas albigilva TaxID=1312364 RepID=UPI00201B8C7F|nr:protein-disulfide reductase DsbD domain-containing protein [Brevundimonas albigilva]UQV17184.1 hypothetical protein MU852_09385 [Brevundimonas albigilva]